MVSVFSLAALCLGILSLSATGLWAYYIPVSLVIVLLWMHAIDLRNRHIAKRIVRQFPDQLSPEERQMFLRSPSLFVFTRGSQCHIFSGCALSYVMPTVVVISFVYVATSAFIQAWGPLLLSACTLVYGLLGPLHNAFPTSNPVDNETMAVERCLIGRYRIRGIGKHVPSCVREEMQIRYWAILNKLHIFDSPQPRGISRQSVLHGINPDSTKGHVSHKDREIAE